MKVQIHLDLQDEEVGPDDSKKLRCIVCLDDLRHAMWSFREQLISKVDEFDQGEELEEMNEASRTGYQKQQEVRRRAYEDILGLFTCELEDKEFLFFLGD